MLSAQRPPTGSERGLDVYILVFAATVGTRVGGTLPKTDDDIFSVPSKGANGGLFPAGQRWPDQCPLTLHQYRLVLVSIWRLS